MAKFTSQNLAILLSGRSLSELASVAQELGDSDHVAYAAINRKAHIERKILSPINRKVDLWCILNPREFVIEIERVREFLEDDRDNLLLTSSAALGAAIDIVRYRPLPGHEKILLLDDWLYAVYDAYYGQNQRELRSVFALTGELSTLFIVLYFLSTCRFHRNVYLFGCDGATAAETAFNSELYFMQDTYDQERLGASAIYRDMVTFEAEWERIAKVFLADRGVQAPNIVNANRASHYSIFDRKDTAAVIAEIKSLPKTGALALQGHTSWKELIDKVSDQVALHRAALIGNVSGHAEGQARILQGIAQIREDNAALRAHSERVLSELKQESLARWADSERLLNELKQESSTRQVQADMLLGEIKQDISVVQAQLASSLPRKIIRALRERFLRGRN